MAGDPATPWWDRAVHRDRRELLRARNDIKQAVREWFGDDFVDVYVAHKEGELAQLDGLDWPAKCARYAEVY